jgi:glyceraldehyde-3-phosphate dehydrogenase (NAD(P))
MADKIKVALCGYGTIGKRVADAVLRQDDMTLVGIAKTKPDYEAYVAAKKGIAIYAVEPAKAESKFKAAWLSIANSNHEMIKKTDIVVDCAPEGMGDEKKKLYEKPGNKAIYWGGEICDGLAMPLNATACDGQVILEQSDRVISSNATGLSRSLYAMVEASIIRACDVRTISCAGSKDNISGPIHDIFSDTMDAGIQKRPDVGLPQVSTGGAPTALDNPPEVQAPGDPPVGPGTLRSPMIPNTPLNFLFNERHHRPLTTILGWHAEGSFRAEIVEACN